MTASKIWIFTGRVSAAHTGAIGALTGGATATAPSGEGGGVAAGNATLRAGASH